MAIEILVTIPLSETLQSNLRGISPKVNFNFYAPQKASDIPADVWARAEVLYTAQILPTPEQAPTLQWIQFHFAGIDAFSSEPIAQREGLTLTTLSGAAASQVAEHALGMLLALAHKIPALLEAQKKSDWPKDRFERFSPVELRDKTVGIVGYGSIGRQLASLLRPLGAKILATKRDAMHPAHSGYTLPESGDPGGDLVERLYPSAALRSMLKLCDFVVLTVPLTADTRGLLNAEMLAALPVGAFLVDVSRGGVLDTDALSQRLKDGKLAGAALDVFPEEPLPGNSPLWAQPNLIISPHISGYSPHYNERAVQLFSENIHRYLAGLTLYNIFEKNRGY
ncbi:MAG: D-2-hydroxyacid dehydrogenase [Anaerolineales bacterium]|jgi:phosphoglycerate dehydrogenase-like enzyme|nr:D-2-hydroxyacid dehydrogenase [Anaerolineales bacterium]